MTREELELRRKLKDEFPLYAKKCLKISEKKTGKSVPFELNSAQKYLYQKEQEMLSATGRVRAIILKGRQQGISTYIQGRAYHYVTHHMGAKAFILTHDSGATENLFAMAQRYHENCNPILKPVLGACNAKELSFAFLDSGYKVGTAGNKSVGRSQTLRFFHGSEVAFWPHAEDHTQGILQCVPDSDDTFVYYESTANGEGNVFHKTWLMALAGESDFTPIFIPWFWQPEYRKFVNNFELKDDEEALLRDTHRLDDMQLAWRRAKIANFGGDADKFAQEYPCTPDEAFNRSGEDVFMPAQDILLARKAKDVPKDGPLLLGVDPAWDGKDYTAIIRRQGHVAFKPEKHKNLDHAQVAGVVGRIIDAEKPAKVFIDCIGVGGGVYTILRNMGFADKLVRVDSSNKLPSVHTGEKYANKRAEMWGLMRAWLADKPVSIPDDDALQTELRSPTYWITTSNAIQLQSKQDMRKNGIPSPDLADALALTFAFPVGYAGDMHSTPSHNYNPRGGSVSWAAL